MRSNNKTSIDGFVPRNSGTHIGDPRAQTIRTTTPPQPARAGRELHAGDEQQPSHRVTRVGVSRSEIDDSLRQIDTPEVDRRGRRRKTPEERAKKRKLIKRIVLAILIVILLVGGFVGIKALIAGSRAFRGNLFDFLQEAPLKQDANGRSNILVFGTSEDDEGGDHPGAELTDSIMVVSIDQTKKDAYMISIARDLWVKLDETCEVGNEAKINTVYMCNSNGGKNEAAGAKALQSKIGEVLGMDIQYYAHVNYTVVSEAVNAVGGVDVKIESEDPRGIYDPNFDWKCNHTCHMVDYKNGQIAHLDGEHALALARARNAEGGYGLPGGNFDREKNQQKIMKALQKKAISAGTLTNVGKVTGLIDSLGNNLRTNFATKEVRTLMKLGKDISGDKLQSISLVNEDKPVLTTGSIYGQSVVIPVAGTYDYHDIAAYVRQQISSDPVAKEAASVVVLNGSTTAGLGQEEADKLEKKGFIISQVGNAPEGTYSSNVLYQIGDGNPATKQKLQKVLGVQVSTGSPNMYLAEDTDFVVIVGQNAAGDQH